MAGIERRHRLGMHTVGPLERDARDQQHGHQQQQDGAPELARDAQVVQVHGSCLRLTMPGMGRGSSLAISTQTR